MQKTKNKVNKKVILYSILALISIALMFIVDWIFIAPAAYLVWLNQKELSK